MAEFVGDLQRALLSWRRHPFLPLVTAAVAAASGLYRASAASMTHDCVAPATSCGHHAGVLLGLSELSFGVGVFQLGYFGAVRLWYLRIWRGASTGPAQVWVDSWAYIGRFLRLGALALLIEVPFFLVVDLLARPVHGNARLITAGTVSAVVLDLMLTFVTPALAYSTGSAVTALRDGLRMLRRHWPADAGYVLVPPLALQALVRLIRAVRSLVAPW
ncbi:MAG TPA: hypothetical protein VNG13_04490 [Mycobacteriales bacterium]|nr:hypothetical protein [Mycobacteriales bacterium]